MKVNRRYLFAPVIAALAAAGTKAVPVKYRTFNPNGGDMGRRTSFGSPDPSECGLFAIEFHRTSPALEAALKTLSEHGAPVYSLDDTRSSPIYGASGGIAHTHIVYFLGGAFG